MKIEEAQIIVRDLLDEWEKHIGETTPDRIEFAAITMILEDHARLVEANRYALATFRALERYTFEDSDHGLLIAEAVKKLTEGE